MRDLGKSPFQSVQAELVIEAEISEQPNRSHSELPRLHRIVHLSIDEAIKIQKDVSRKWLAIFLIPFPILLLFGYGFLDQIADWHTNGKVTSFGKKEKIIALYLGYTFMVLWMIFLIMAIILL